MHTGIHTYVQARTGILAHIGIHIHWHMYTILLAVLCSLVITVCAHAHTSNSSDMLSSTGLDSQGPVQHLKTAWSFLLLEKETLFTGHLQQLKTGQSFHILTGVADGVYLALVSPTFMRRTSARKPTPLPLSPLPPSCALTQLNSTTSASLPCNGCSIKRDAVCALCDCNTMTRHKAQHAVYISLIENQI